MRSETCNVDIYSLLSHIICIFGRLYATTRHVVIILYLYIESYVYRKWIRLNFLQNLSKTQFYPDEAIIFIVFTYRKIALCHTAYVTGRAMECQECR